MFVHVETHANTLYDRVGGQPFFDALVEHFYSGVESDRLLRLLYPPDLEAPKRHLGLFLAQYWGGPTTYSDERGHPRLRMRHVRFAIGRAERESWMQHMRHAVDSSKASDEDKHALLAYFESAATSLINQ